VASDGCLLTYRELDRASNKMARALLRLGVAPGDRVGILAPKSAAAVIGLYGALKAGACYVPLDPKAPTGRLRHILRDSGAAVIVADEARASAAAALAGAVPRPPGVVVASVAGGGEAVEIGRAHV
jgi:acyl-CoA synthetase (AMP-forming)/AMP-acid ligase II